MAEREHAVVLAGSGRVAVIAYGLADAEHRVQKELARLWPEARVEITEVLRPEGGQRIAEEFHVGYRLGATLRVHAATAEAAGREALRQARQRLGGSRYARTELRVARDTPA